jgi:hypothetical protein
LNPVAVDYCAANRGRINWLIARQVCLHDVIELANAGNQQPIPTLSIGGGIGDFRSQYAGVVRAV